MPDYNAMELMICVAARLLENGSTVGVGTGAPCAAAMLAQKTGSPELYIVFEAGGLSPQLPSMPISVGDSRTFHKALMATTMSRVFDACQRGMVDYTFLGGAQIDAYGNLNSTVIGDHAKPKVRFPGSGGANDFASSCWNTIVMTSHNTNRFVEKLDFLTTPGYLTGPGAREEAGLPENAGPYKIITDLAVLRFNDQTKRMEVESLHPDITFQTVQENTGFALGKAESIHQTEPPKENELTILREQVDPNRYVIGR
jgi:glutaconate CoA-transferase, subunit B